jgi:hypothetical protein
MPRLPRLTPSFVVAVLALVVASGGVGFAAGRVTSAQIQDGTIRTVDIRNNTIRGIDVRPNTIPRNRLNKACIAGEVRVFGGCVRRTSSGPSSYQAAIDNCNRRNGRLPTTAEIKWIAAHDEFTWATGNPSQYEFTGDYTATNPYTPIAFDRAGNAFPNASAQLFWHHCVTY